ncbi:hypothetical protein [Streptomyces sp. NPDC005548]|uniref:hypothetical protein n=1 Tax=unclassified Streptomyces TaxID=2593676 RepID=UPI0036AA99B4
MQKHPEQPNDPTPGFHIRTASLISAITPARISVGRICFDIGPYSKFRAAHRLREFLDMCRIEEGSA